METQQVPLSIFQEKPVDGKTPIGEVAPSKENVIVAPNLDVTDKPADVVAEPKKETPIVTDKPTDTTAPKFWETAEYKEMFGEESVDNLKSYKTKVSEYEQKLQEYEEMLNEEVFANENIKQLNELAKQGIAIDEQTVAFINKDYSKITEPTKLISEYLKHQNPDWSEKKVQFEMSKLYGLDRIEQQTDEDGELIPLTEKQKEIQEIINEDIQRDAKYALNKLRDEQDKIRFKKAPEPTAEEIAMEKAQRVEQEKYWGETVKNISSKHSKITVEFSKEVPIVIDGKQVQLPTVEYTPTKEEKAVADKIFQQLGDEQPNALLAMYADKNGDLNNDDSRSKIYDLILNSVTQNSRTQALAEQLYKSAYEHFVKTDKKATDSLKNGATPTRVGANGKVPFSIFEPK